MGTGLLHLFPDVTEMLSKANVNLYMRSSFPVAEFTVAFGFLLVLVLEQIVQECKERRTEYNMLQGGTVRSNPANQSQVPEAEHQVEADSSRTVNVPVYHEPEPHPVLRALVLLFSLSLHSLLEGLAVGLQTDVSDLIQIFVAVVIHKTVIAFSLGLSLVQTELSLASIIKSNLLFSITSPLGICSAIALQQFGHSLNSSITNGILQGLACGTFVYVTFFEVLPHELNQKENRLLKLLALLLGFSVVCFVLFLDPAESPHCSHP
ncbi:zinc transporter ZIP1 isoform X2 [Cryptotermes secundus]|nr:zinc transporter ZIP1 isoform X2 [Cryptotermes secundus]